MNTRRHINLGSRIWSVLCLGLALSAGNALGQANNQLVGTWTPIAIYIQAEDGTKSDVFGAKPVGALTFGSDGRFSLQWMRSDLPKFASGDRLKGTAEENQAHAA